MIKYLAGVAILVVVLYFLVAGLTLFKPQPQPRFAGPLEKISIGRTSATPELSSLLFVAEDQGYFGKHGLEVTFSLASTSADVMQQIDSGKIDIGTVSDFSFVTASFNSSDKQIFSIINKSDNVKLVCRRDKGVNTPADLSAKKISFVAKTNSEFYLGRYLTFNNLTLKDIYPVASQPDQAINDLIAGKLDCAVTGEPRVSMLREKLGSSGIFLPVQLDQPLYWLLVANRETIKARAEMIERLLLSLLEAENFTKNQSVWAQAVVARLTNQDLRYIQNTWTFHEFSLSLDQPLFLLMEDETRWAMENHLTSQTKIPNYLDYIYFDGLQRVAPGKVTVIH